MAMSSYVIDCLSGDTSSIIVWVGLWSSLYLFGEIIICSVLSRIAYRNQSNTIENTIENTRENTREDKEQTGDTVEIDIVNDSDSIRVKPDRKRKIRGVLVEKDKYIHEWNKNRNTKSEYILWWNSFTRLVSTLHAVLVVYYAIVAYLEYGNNVLNFEFEVTNSEDTANIVSINIIMIGYLITDLIFLVIERTESNIRETIIHHVIGIVSLYGFIVYKTFPFNSLYYNITEITTIPLNITWIMLHFELHKSIDYPVLGIIFTLLGLLAWILYLVVRVFGGVVLSYYLSLNYDRVLALPPYCLVFAVLGNGTITVLNFIWFYKLTKMAFKQLIPQNKTKVL